MTRDELRQSVYIPIQQVLQDAVTMAMTSFGPSALDANRDMEKWGRVKTALDGLVDAFEKLKDPRMPEARALADIKLRAPALSAIAAELDPEGLRQGKVIERLHAAQEQLEASVAKQLQR